MASLVVNVGAMRHNLKLIRQACEEAGAECLFVFKEAGLRPELVRCLLEDEIVPGIGVNCFGRIPAVPSGVKVHQIYLVGDDRLPDAARADVVYQTGLRSIRGLAEAAKARGVRPEVMLMVEMGDGRDGVEPDALLPIAAEVVRHDSLRLRGLATNFACVGTEEPTLEALRKMVECRDLLERDLGHPVPELSVGGSDVLELAGTTRLPAGITEIRCGTAVHLGIYPLSGKPVPGASRRAAFLRGQVLECRLKGGRRRAVLDFGVLHTEPERLYPELPGMVLQGASSGYSIYDVTDCPVLIEDGMTCTFGLHFSSFSRSLAAVAELPLELLREENDG